jgi:hypothetical protein
LAALARSLRPQEDSVTAAYNRYTAAVEQVAKLRSYCMPKQFELIQFQYCSYIPFCSLCKVFMTYTNTAFTVNFYQQ